MEAAAAAAAGGVGGVGSVGGVGGVGGVGSGTSSLNTLLSHPSLWDSIASSSRHLAAAGELFMQLQFASLTVVTIINQPEIFILKAV